MSGKLPKWAQDRLDEDASMGGSFEGSSGERIGWSAGVLLVIALQLLVWAFALCIVVAVLYLVGQAMGWSS